MARVKRGLQAHKRHKKILQAAKGYKLGRKNIFRLAKQAVLKAGQYSYRDRRNKKRDFRKLWIVQLNAAARAHEMSYSQFIYGLNKAELNINRKVLAEMSVKAPDKFASIAVRVKAALAKD
ncbi:MAG: 50S ribosomal protein L20 [Candidatus Berkelbacteria bacterium]|nr:MAG: 50S ribosomal protein L20 [Candidatus Berkelbacteria bacterium]QQG52001.1 MAG: 50S ribosomal protein L20 [Candidatus Berkelbacteria bacterium]